MPARPHGPPWTDEQDKAVRAFAESGMTDAEIARILGRTASAIETRRAKLGIRKEFPERRPWTPEEDAAIREGFHQGLPDREIAHQLGRKRDAVAARRSRLGMTRTKTEDIRPMATDAPSVSARTCQWIDGEVRPGGDVDFCGAPAQPGWPYCTDHCVRAYQYRSKSGTHRPFSPEHFDHPPQQREVRL